VFGIISINMARHSGEKVEDIMLLSCYRVRGCTVNSVHGLHNAADIVSGRELFHIRVFMKILGL
jgi:hypothetical protein